MKKYFIFILLLSTSCNNIDKKNNVQSTIIDFQTLHQINYSQIEKQIIKEKIYINLEAEEDSFLFNKIDNIKINNDRIFIQDERLKSLLVFNMDGQGITKVGTFGRGPGEYTNIADFDIDHNGYIYILDGQQDKLNIYNPDYTFRKSYPFSLETDIIKCLANNNLLLGLSSWNTETKNKIIVTDSLLKPIKHYFEYDNYVDDNFWLFGYHFTEANDRILYNRPIDNHIHIFTNKGELEKTLYYDFGSKNVPDVAKKDIETHFKDYENYCTIGDFTFLYDKYIGGTLFNKHSLDLYLLDTLNHTLYLKETQENDIEKFISYSSKMIISYLDPGKFLDHLPSREKYPKEVYDHLKKGNFVLCLYKLY